MKISENTTKNTTKMTRKHHRKRFCILFNTGEAYTLAAPTPEAAIQKHCEEYDVDIGWVLENSTVSRTQ